MPNDKISQKAPDIVVAMDHEGAATVDGEPVAFDDVINVVKRKTGRVCETPR